MISSAKANFQRISPRKARVVINMVRGRDADEALQLLDFTPKAAAPIVKKLLASAVAIFADGALAPWAVRPRLKRASLISPSSWISANGTKNTSVWF